MPAPPNVGQLVAAAWQDYVKQDPADQIFQHFWLLENLRAGDTFKKGAGSPIVGTIEYTANTTVKSMSDLETLDVIRVDVFDRYEYAYKQIGGLLVMSEFEKAATSNGGAIFDLMAGKMENLKKSLMAEINAELFSDGTANASKGVGGLKLIVANNPTTGTVGIINRATFTFWRNQAVDATKTTAFYDNAKSKLRTLYNLCSSGTAMQVPEFLVGDRASFEGYEGVLTTNERLVRSSASDTAISGYKGDHIMFKDCPFSWDAASPAEANGAVYMLNRRNLFIRYMAWMKAFPPESAVNQFADVVKILNILNLCSDNPRRLGVAYNFGA